MLGEGKEEMGISRDEDGEEVVQLLAEALECNDESWQSELERGPLSSAVSEIANSNNEIHKDYWGRAKASPAPGCIMIMN